MSYTDEGAVTGTASWQIMPGWSTNPIAGLDLPAAEAWVGEAICSQTDPEEFFPEKGGTTTPGKRICNLCPVKDECLQYAMDHDERWGIWGGLSARERMRLKRDIAPRTMRRPNGHGYACRCISCDMLRARRSGAEAC